MADFPLQRMRFNDDGTAEEFPPRSEPTGRWVRLPTDPEYTTDSWPLGLGVYDAYGDPIQ
jgi:hypothetical protein